MPLKKLYLMKSLLKQTAKKWNFIGTLKIMKHIDER